MRSRNPPFCPAAGFDGLRRVSFDDIRFCRCQRTAAVDCLRSFPRSRIIFVQRIFVTVHLHSGATSGGAVPSCRRKLEHRCAHAAHERADAFARSRVQGARLVTRRRTHRQDAARRRLCRCYAPRFPQPSRFALNKARYFRREYNVHMYIYIEFVPSCYHRPHKNPAPGARAAVDSLTSSIMPENLSSCYDAGIEFLP